MLQGVGTGSKEIVWTLRIEEDPRNAQTIQAFKARTASVGPGMTLPLGLGGGGGIGAMPLAGGSLGGGKIGGDGGSSLDKGIADAERMLKKHFADMERLQRQSAKNRLNDEIAAMREMARNMEMQDRLMAEITRKEEKYWRDLHAAKKAMRAEEGRAIEARNAAYQSDLDAAVRQSGRMPARGGGVGGGPVIPVSGMSTVRGGGLSMSSQIEAVTQLGRAVMLFSSQGEQSMERILRSLMMFEAAAQGLKGMATLARGSGVGGGLLGAAGRAAPAIGGLAIGGLWLWQQIEEDRARVARNERARLHNDARGVLGFHEGLTDNAAQFASVDLVRASHEADPARGLELLRAGDERLTANQGRIRGDLREFGPGGRGSANINPAAHSQILAGLHGQDRQIMDARLENLERQRAVLQELRGIEEERARVGIQAQTEIVGRLEQQLELAMRAKDVATDQARQAIRGIGNMGPGVVSRMEQIANKLATGGELNRSDSAFIRAKGLAGGFDEAAGRFELRQGENALKAAPKARDLLFAGANKQAQLADNLGEMIEANRAELARLNAELKEKLRVAVDEPMRNLVNTINQVFIERVQASIEELKNREKVDRGNAGAGFQAP